MLERRLVKEALVGARQILAHQAEMAERRRAAAARKSHKLQLVNELIDETHRSPVRSSLHGAFSGATMLGLPMIAPSLYYRNPAWALGGAAVGALGGGFLGAKLPSLAEGSLRSYAAGERDPVFYGDDGDVTTEPLGAKERSLLRRVLGARRG